jgi:hypothetical protein
MHKRLRTAVFCCLTLVDLGLLAFIPASIHWLNPAPDGLQFSAPAQPVPSVTPRPDQDDDCNSAGVRSAWCEPRYVRQI